MKFIKKQSIEEVLDQATALEVIKHTEEVVKKGANYFCHSPFTKEKNASMAINPVKNFWKDFSSGYGGNAISFLMKKNPSMTFFEAIEMAASICGITLEFEERSDDQKRMDDESESLKNLVEFANVKYQQQLNSLGKDSWAKKMIEAERGYGEDIVSAFMLGYAPAEDKSFITTIAINNGNYGIAKHVGLTSTKENSSYDFFRDRIIFPIHDHNGIVVGFGGRRSNQEDQIKIAKYLNSKESKIYKKSRVLYGLYQAKRSINVSKYAVLMEGYTDVISSHQNGTTTAIASCGTALTPEQVKLISRYCSHVIIFRDGDAAGLKASMRDMDILLRHNFKVEVVICPEGEDPDSLSKKYNLNEYISENKKDAIIWKSKELLEQSKLEEYDSMVKAITIDYKAKRQRLYDGIISPDKLKAADATERKILKSENDNVIKSVAELDKLMKRDIDEVSVYDPQKLSENTESIAVSLSLILNEVKFKEYLRSVCKIMNVSLKTMESMVLNIREEAAKLKGNETVNKEEYLKYTANLPEGANIEQFLKDRYCEVGDLYHFQTKSGDFFVGTNHTITPLFHIEGNQDNKRLCEVKNIYGGKRLIDFESTDIINFTKFKERLIREGNFFWEPGATNEHFLLVSRKLTNEFITASELKILGHQKEGFFAFADGVFHNNQFMKVNKYGIVHVEGVNKSASEYKADISHYYSPSHSEIYKSAREDDDPFENDRYFVYSEAPIRLEQWMEQFVKVFGDKAKLGIAFVVGAMFRDIFLSNFKYFPLMGGFGQKDSGKSGFGACLQSIFSKNMPALELNTSTLVGMSRRLTRIKNSVVFFDEYRDDIDEDKHQNLKGAWNGIGREKGKGADTNRTTTDKINSAIYYAGQYLPTKDDGALPSRSIILNFGQQERTIEEKEEYGKLMNWNKAGLSSFILDIIKNREYFNSKLLSVYSETMRDLKNSFKSKEQEYQNRVFDNYLILLVTVRILEDKVSFPYTYNQFFELVEQSIVDNSDSISDSDGLATFWRTLEYMSSTKVIKEKHDYLIKVDPYVKRKIKRETDEWKNTSNYKILYLDFKKVHQDYHLQVSKKQGEEVIQQTTIVNYLKTKKYFIGLTTKRINPDKATSCYAFNYSMMQRLGILDLEEEARVNDDDDDATNIDGIDF